MMETNKKHTENALKQALRRRQPGRLPSNFNYRMMEQIRLEAEKQQIEAVFSSGEPLSAERVNELSHRMEQLLERIDALEMRWLELSEQKGD